MLRSKSRFAGSHPSPPWVTGNPETGTPTISFRCRPNPPTPKEPQLRPRGMICEEISRFSCMLFLSVRGFLDYAGPDNPLAINVVVVLPSSTRNRVGVLFHRLFEAQ